MMLVVLVALSGCGGLFGHPEQSPGSSDDPFVGVTAADGSLVVSEGGVVHGARLRTEGTNDGASYRVDVNCGVVRLGNVSVERPAWADAAARQG